MTTLELPQGMATYHIRRLPNLPHMFVLEILLCDCVGTFLIEREVYSRKMLLDSIHEFMDLHRFKAYQEETIH